MGLFSSRAQQLAAHLRKRILSNEWPEPLPSTRDWARQLAVGRNSLCAALGLLKEEGLLIVDKRQGVRLARGKTVRKAAPGILRAVRVVYYGVDYRELDPYFIRWAGPLSTVLQKHDIHFSIEKCSAERLRRICRGRHKLRGDAHELLMPVGIPVEYQRILKASGRPCIQVGTPAPDVGLPFVVCDLAGCVRHATHTLLRRGFPRLVFVLGGCHAPGTPKMSKAFLSACEEWKQHHVHAEILEVSLRDADERVAFARLADRIKTRLGIVITPPVSVSLLATVLLSCGIRMPEQAELVVVASNPDSISIHPRPSHYPLPMNVLVKTLANAAIHFFDTGSIPFSSKVLPMTLVPAGG